MPGGSTTNQNTAQNQFSTEAGNTTGATTGTQQQQQQQQSQSGPWQATQPLLSNILSSLNGMSTAPSAAQSDALTTLQAGADQTPNFGNAATGVTNNLLGSTPQYNGMLTGGLSDYSSTLSPYLSSSYLNPMTTPGLSDTLNTTANDITNSINSQFAAAGRDLSPANSTALARGLTQGLAPIITNQYNTNAATQLGAANNLFSATGATAGGLSGLDQTALGNQATGVNLAGSIPGLYTAPGTTQLGAATTAQALPYANLGMLSGATLPIAQLGQSTSGTGTTTGATAGTTAGSYTGDSTGASNGTSTTTQQQSLLSSILGGLFGGVGTLGKTGAFGDAGWLTSLFGSGGAAPAPA